jgi:hypothetical protein
VKNSAPPASGANGVVAARPTRRPPSVVPGSVSASSSVPSSVPSLRQSSTPCTPSSAAKTSRPLTTASRTLARPVIRLPAMPSAAPGLMSRTRRVPAALPSLRHSS